MRDDKRREIHANVHVIPAAQAVVQAFFLLERVVTGLPSDLNSMLVIAKLLRNPTE